MTQDIIQALAKDPVPVLNRGYKAAERIAWRQQRITQWENIVYSITAAPDKGGGGNSYPESKIEKAVAAITALQDEILDEITMLAGYEHEAREIISTYVSAPIYKAVLELRYCRHESWENIANILHYSPDWVQKLHRQAIMEIKEDVKICFNL